MTTIEKILKQLHSDGWVYNPTSQTWTSPETTTNLDPHTDYLVGITPNGNIAIAKAEGWSLL